MNNKFVEIDSYGSMNSDSKFPSCVSCLHYRKPKSFVWKDDWGLLLFPVFGWFAIIALLLDPKTPWCVAGQALCGEQLDDGPSCHKMRCFGSCGADGKLHTPNSK